MTSKDCSILINGHQLREALSFLAPDNTEEQLDQEVIISTGGAECHSGPGLYCWLDEYPEEGAIKLDGTSPAALSAPPGAVPAELTNVRCMCGDEYPHDSYGAGFIAGSGMCENCDAAQRAVRDADRKAMDELKAMSFDELLRLSEGKAPPAAGVPEGYKWYLVPKEDTDAFNAACSAANDAYLGGVGPCGVFIAGYRAMLAAAPTPPASEQQQAVVPPKGKLLVSAEPLRKVLFALLGAPHHIQELLATRTPTDLFADNPINVLITEFNAAQGGDA